MTRSIDPQRKCLPCPAVAALLLMLLAGAAASGAQADGAEAAGKDQGSLRINVADAASGQPLAARLAIRAADGSWPGDMLGCAASRWPHIEAHGTFVNGETTFDLPAGMTRVTAAHGLEYRAASIDVEVRSGVETPLELKLERVCDMRRAGWVAGDLHVHMMHGENERQTSYQEVARVCAANGLDFVCVGQEYVGAGKLDLAGYHAACRQASSGAFQMFLGGERPKSLLGHQALLGVHNPFVIAEDPPYFISARKVHAQGGALVYVHPVRYFPGKEWQGKPLDFPGNNLARELVFDAYAGPSFDGLSVLSDEPANPRAHRLWFNLLNRGMFVPAFADSDACFDRSMLGLKAPGFWNTYFYIGPSGRVEPETLVEAVRKGRTMATTGPLLLLTIDGQVSGATLPADGRPRKLRIEAYAPQHAFSLETTDGKSGGPYGLGRIELIRNGQTVQAWEPMSDTARIEHVIEESETCWYVARAVGSDAQWQVAVASPIYFAPQSVPAKRQPLAARVRGRIYDFETGREAAGRVIVHRGAEVLARFKATGKFRLDMPIDAEIRVEADGFRPITKNLLLDYGPVHRFLWHLESEDLANAATLEKFELLMRDVELEFAVGQRMPGCYFVTPQDQAESTAAQADDGPLPVNPVPGNPVPLSSVRIGEGPARVSHATLAVAAVILDTEQISPGHAMRAGVIFRDEGQAERCGPLVVEARGYDPSRPMAYGALKKFAEFESRWESATDLGQGYRLIQGELAVPDWVQAGPAGAIDIGVRVRHAEGHAAFIGLRVPLGPTRRAWSVSSPWPAMPLSWPDGSYGIGPLRITNRNGRAGAPASDYRELQITFTAGEESFDVLPLRDGRGCADADDALYTGHYLDQVLSDETAGQDAAAIREQPRHDFSGVRLIDATGSGAVE